MNEELRRLIRALRLSMSDLKKLLDEMPKENRI